MYCYIVDYSFCDDRIVHGPYATQEETMGRMIKEAVEEKRIDKDEAGYESKLVIDENSRTITLTTPNGDVTIWEAFEMED